MVLLRQLLIVNGILRRVYRLMAKDVTTPLNAVVVYSLFE